MTKPGANRLDACAGRPCPYCGKRMGKSHPKRGDAPTRDHIYPQSRGGKLTVICCRNCNAAKGDLSIDEWSVILLVRRDWRAANVNKLATALRNRNKVVLPASVIGLMLPNYADGIGEGVFA